MSANETEQSQLSAGELLKQLREEKEMSIDEVSEKIHLEPRVIEALEANNFEILPAATYARGYLRSYAKLLGADAEKVISLYNNDAPEAPEIIPEIKHPTQTSSTDKPVKAFSYLLSLVLVLLVIAWWQSDLIVEIPESTNEQVRDTNKTIENDIVVQDTQSSIAVENIDNVSLNKGILEEEESIDTTPADSLSETLDGVVEEISITNDSTTEEPVVTASPELDIEIENEYRDPLEGRDIIDTRGEGPDQITIVLTADSWVEVFETDGDKLYLNLARNGQTLILNGTSPFSVLLGFSQGAAISFNGKQIDHAPYSRSGIARFNVGREGTSARE